VRTQLIIFERYAYGRPFSSVSIQSVEHVGVWARVTKYVFGQTCFRASVVDSIFYIIT